MAIYLKCSFFGFFIIDLRRNVTVVRETFLPARSA